MKQNFTAQFFIAGAVAMLASGDAIARNGHAHKSIAPASVVIAPSFISPNLVEPDETPQADSAASSGEAKDMAKLTYHAAQTLIERSEGLAKDRPIVVATVVSVDDLNKSSTFGRLASQLVANRIEQRGFLVRDVNYMRALTVRPETGELALSREAAKVSSSVNAQAVVVGTYAVGGKEIYLSLRLLRADNGEMLSSADAAIPLDENTSVLVGGSSDRMPYDQYLASRQASE